MARLVEVWLEDDSVEAFKRGVVCSGVDLAERPDGTFDIGLKHRQGHARFAGFTSACDGRERHREVGRTFFDG